MGSSERRRYPRIRTLKAARILFNGHHSVINCMVRNLGPGGACLKIASAIGIPERFDLIFDADKSVRGCRQVWHREQQIGIAFDIPLAS
jgi:hypothetical protein